MIEYSTENEEIDHDKYKNKIAKVPSVERGFIKIDKLRLVRITKNKNEFTRTSCLRTKGDISVEEAGDTELPTVDD